MPERDADLFKISFGQVRQHGDVNVVVGECRGVSLQANLHQPQLHGDFRSRRLKNTTDELRHQDVRLRRTLVESCIRFGLVVAGYSGRDSSIMDALDEAAGQSGAFPAGLFWFHRGEDPPAPRVRSLLTRAATNGVEAAIVPIENFDEALRDSVRLIGGLDMTVLHAFATERRRWSPALRPVSRRA